jgi:cytidine deaminase
MKRISEIAIKKAKQSSCTYKVSAIGLNKRGEIIYKAINKQRFYRRGGGLHAEMEVMRKAGPRLKTIILCRVGRGGDLRPIDPCPVCAKKASELSVKIITVKES